MILRRRKLSPMFARVEQRRRAVAEAVGDPAATERHGAQNPGVSASMRRDRLARSAEAAEARMFGTSTGSNGANG